MCLFIPTKQYRNRTVLRIELFTINLGTKRLTVNNILTLGKVTFTVENFVNATGMSGGDSIVGDNSNNLFNGGSGNDGLSGVDGNDTLLGNAGNDF